MSDNATRAAVEEMYEAYRRGDADRIAAMLDDDIDWIIYAPVQVLSYTGARRGKAAVLAAIGDISKSFSLERYDPQVTVIEGDRAAVMSEAAFTQRSTGRRLRMRIAHFLRFRGGKLVEFREFSDTFDVVEQVLGRWLDVGGSEQLA
jgi:ketosteroid isomerase-like protein